MPVQKRNSLRLSELTLQPFEYPTRRRQPRCEVGDKTLSNDDMLYGKRHSDGDVYVGNVIGKRHTASDDMSCVNRVSVDDMLYDKTLCDDDILSYKRLSATGSSDTASSGVGSDTSHNTDRYSANLHLPSSVS